MHTALFAHFQLLYEIHQELKAKLKNSHILQLILCNFILHLTELANFFFKINKLIYYIACKYRAVHTAISNNKVRRVNTLHKVWLCDWMDFPHLDIFMLIQYTAESRVLTQLNTE